MANKEGTTRALVITSQKSTVSQQTYPLRLELLNEDGSPAGVIKKQEDQDDSTATDVAGLKSDFNDLLAKLRAANILG